MNTQLDLYVKEQSTANRAFENAYFQDALSKDGEWMYMYTDSHHDYFKNVITREYIKCLKEVRS